MNARERYRAAIEKEAIGGDHDARLRALRALHMLSRERHQERRQDQQRLHAEQRQDALRDARHERQDEHRREARFRWLDARERSERAQARADARVQLSVQKNIDRKREMEQRRDDRLKREQERATRAHAKAFGHMAGSFIGVAIHAAAWLAVACGLIYLLA